MQNRYGRQHCQTRSSIRDEATGEAVTCLSDPL